MGARKDAWAIRHQIRRKSIKAAQQRGGFMTAATE
jgi:hypothetical protein